MAELTEDKDRQCVRQREATSDGRQMADTMYDVDDSHTIRLLRSAVRSRRVAIRSERGSHQGKWRVTRGARWVSTTRPAQCISAAVAPKQLECGSHGREPWTGNARTSAQVKAIDRQCIRAGLSGLVCSKTDRAALRRRGRGACWSASAPIFRECDVQESPGQGTTSYFTHVHRAVGAE